MTAQQKKKLTVIVATFLCGSGIYSLVASLPEQWHRPALVLLPFIGMIAGVFLPAAVGEARAEKVVADDAPPLALSPVAPVLEQVADRGPLDIATAVKKAGPLALLALLLAGCAHGHYEALPLADPTACARGIAAAAVDQLPCDKKKPDPQTCAAAAAKAALDLGACVPPLHWIPDASTPLQACAPCAVCK